MYRKNIVELSPPPDFEDLGEAPVARRGENWLCPGYFVRPLRVEEEAAFGQEAPI